MKQIAVYIAMSIFFAGCDPGYRIYVYNNSSTDIYIKTYPTIESFYLTSTSYRDSILMRKIGQDAGRGIYKIKSYDTFNLFSHIGFEPNTNEIPFDYVSIIKGRDTLELKSKKEIFNHIKLMSKRKQKGNYYIDISNVAP